uniref:Protein kinase domain-containing protein n=1 Tax=Acrobeloides nanus TaxID=290746 RepID=A0A914D8F0_9BILA
MTRGVLIQYEGQFVPFAKQPPPKSYLLWKILGPALAIVLISSILISCYYYRVRQKEKQMDFIIEVMERQKRLSPEEIEELKEKRDEFTIVKKNLKIYYEFPLGQGASSSVYVGFIYGKSPLMVATGLIETQRFQDCKVAVKVPSSFGQDETEQLFREIDSMKKIGYNENVICMLGICFLDEKPVIAFELADKNLLSYVSTLRETILGQIQAPVNIFFSILWQIARGMQYISSKNIVHRDLAARNVLLTDSFNAKISDFGLSLCADLEEKSSSSTPQKLPVKWLSLEALLNKVFSVKSDVWAFGVLMFEVFSFGSIPYKDVILEELIEMLKNGDRLECPKAANEETYEIMRSCWQEDPEARPIFEQLSERFREMLESRTMTYGYVEGSK